MRSARRRAAALLFVLFVPLPGRAGALDEELLALQHDWEVVRYQTPALEREKRYEALAERAHALSAAHPQRSEALACEGTIVGSWADERRGLAALRLVRRARALHESALRLDADALDGSALNGLAALYYKSPGWPIGFGDARKARELLQQALRLHPDGIDANTGYGEFLLRSGHAAQAVPYLERAIAAPPRPEHRVGDTGRRAEARALLARALADH